MATTVTTHGGERYGESLVIELCSGGGHNGGREHVDMWKECEKCLPLARLSTGVMQSYGGEVREGGNSACINVSS